MVVNSINPATGEIIAKFDYLGKKKAYDEVTKSREAFKEWGVLGIGERCSYLAKAAEVLKRNSRKYGEIISLEMGKPIVQAVSEVEKCAWSCNYYAENAEEFLSDVEVKTEAKRALVTYQPMGTIVGVMPWNFPFWQVFRFASATLAAGNTIVVKHSSNVPQCGIAIEEVFHEAGFPDYVYRNLIIDSSTVKELVEGNLVEGISLTGSTEAGSRIGELGGRAIKKVVLELGGSDPYVVLEGADVEKAASVAVTARFQNCGQSCIAAKRFIVDKKVYEEFKREFVEKTEKLVLGDPLAGKTTLGPLARDDLRLTVEKQLNSANSEGVKTITGGKRPERAGYFFEPTVIEAKKPSKTINEEEFFGPVASIMSGKDEDELLRIANSSLYGLGSSVWCDDINRAEKFARGLETGMVTINDMLRSDPRLPFGGIKKSGVGRELGNYGIKEFVNIKSIVVS